MIRVDQYGRGYTQIAHVADQFKVQDTRDIYVMKIPEHYKQKLLTEGMRVKFYTYDKVTNTYHLPPSAGKKTEPKTKIEFNLKSSELYPEQVKVLSDIRKAGERAAFIESETGTGKSFILSGLIALHKCKTIIVVPNISIARGLLEKVSKRSDKVYLAQGSKIKGAEETNDIVICHHSTFNTHYDYINGKYDMLILDEGHKLPPKRIKQLSYRKGSCAYGLSATPIRKEFGRDGIEKIFGKIYNTHLKALNVKVLIHKFRYDYNEEEVEKATEGLAPDSNEIFRRLIMDNEKRYTELSEIIKQLELAGYTKMIIFSDRVKHIEKTIATLRPLGFDIVGYYGASDKNESEMLIKSSNKYIIVGHPTSCGEGFDVPAIEVTILFTSTGREGIVRQMAGRARRVEGSKKEGILVDFVDQLSIMGGKTKALSFSNRMKIYKQLDWETTAL